MHSPSLTTHIAFIEGVGGPELMMILFVVLLLFGGEKLPEFARGFGKAMREFRKAAGNVEDEFKRAIDDVERNAAIDVHLEDKPTRVHAVPTSAPAAAAQRTGSLSPTADAAHRGDRSPPERASDSHSSEAPN